MGRGLSERGIMVMTIDREAWGKMVYRSEEWEGIIETWIIHVRSDSDEHGEHSACR